MRMKTFLACAIVVAGLLGIATGQRPPIALADRACGAAPPAAAIAANGIVGAAAPAITGVSGPSMLRHVASAPAGTALVRDLPGSDEIVLTSAGRSVTIPQRGEVSHPAWGPGGSLAWGVDDRLALRSPTGTVRSIEGPRPGGVVVAPVFDGADVVAIVSAPPTHLVPEDEWSNDLWRYRSSSGRWARLTSFPADADRWTAIRTPVVTPDGSIEFVVIRGRASATAMPRFSLWRLRRGAVERVASLSDERYLAGFDGEGARLWNVPDRANARWLIRRETSTGEETVGCGAVAVDPFDVVDPDRTGHEQPRSRTSGAAAELPGDPIESALLVGDFASEAAAGLVAHQVSRAYAGGLPVDIVRGSAHSGIVQPGHWAVVVRLPATTDGTAELDALRVAFPALASHTWIAVP